MKTVDCQSLDDVRMNIDRIDKELVRLIAERSTFVDRAAQFKQTEQEVEAPRRVEQVITKVRDLAKREKLNPDIAESIYRTMIAAFIQQEFSVIRTKK